MRRREQPRIGDLELQILNVLWERGPSTVREVLEALPPHPRQAYTTILTMLRYMHEKGFVDRDERGKAHVYRARLRERPVKRGLLRGLVETAFRGSAEAVIARLLEDEQLTPEELARVKELIEAKEQEGRR
jgi:BlaI family penicillinase repressor